jgi:hypothetical protein
MALRRGDTLHRVRAIAAAPASSQIQPVVLELDPIELEPPAIGPLPTARTPCAVVGFPARVADVPREAFAKHFVDEIRHHLVIRGRITAIHADGTFEHDCFSLDGAEGGPVIDLRTGNVIGMHLGPTPVDGARRSIAIAAAAFHAPRPRREQQPPPRPRAAGPGPRPPAPSPPVAVTPSTKTLQVTIPITIKITIGDK